LVEVGKHCFQNCKLLSSLKFPLAAPMNIDSDNSGSGSGRETIVPALMSVLVSVPVPIIRIGQGAFEGCLAMQKITLPSSCRDDVYSNNLGLMEYVAVDFIKSENDNTSDMVSGSGGSGVNTRYESVETDQVELALEMSTTNSNINNSSEDIEV
jgi:hypothetical protein